MEDSFTNDIDFSIICAISVCKYCKVKSGFVINKSVGGWTIGAVVKGIIRMGYEL